MARKALSNAGFGGEEGPALVTGAFGLPKEKRGVATNWLEVAGLWCCWEWLVSSVSLT